MTRKAWVKFCTPDAQLVTVRGESMKGIAEIERGLTAIFQTRGRNVTLKTLEVAVRFIRPDVALAHVTNELTGLVSPEGRTLLPHQELSIRVLVRIRASGASLRFTTRFCRSDFRNGVTACVNPGFRRFARRYRMRCAPGRQRTTVQTPGTRPLALSAGTGNRSPT